MPEGIQIADRHSDPYAWALGQAALDADGAGVQILIHRFASRKRPALRPPVALRFRHQGSPTLRRAPSGTRASTRNKT